MNNLQRPIESANIQISNPIDVRSPSMASASSLEYFTNNFTSIFSEKTPTDLMAGGSEMFVLYIPLLVFGIILASIGYYEYMYPEKYKNIIGSILLYFHLGKDNEIHTTEIPEESNTYSILSLFGIKNALDSPVLEPY